MLREVNTSYSGEKVYWLQKNASTSNKFSPQTLSFRDSLRPHHLKHQKKTDSETIITNGLNKNKKTCVHHVGKQVKIKAGLYLALGWQDNPGCNYVSVIDE